MKLKLKKCSNAELRYHRHSHLILSYFVYLSQCLQHIVFISEHLWFPQTSWVILYWSELIQPSKLPDLLFFPLSLWLRKCSQSITQHSLFSFSARLRFTGIPQPDYHRWGFMNQWNMLQTLHHHPIQPLLHYTLPTDLAAPTHLPMPHGWGNANHTQE